MPSTAADGVDEVTEVELEKSAGSDDVTFELSKLSSVVNGSFVAFCVEIVDEFWTEMAVDDMPPVVCGSVVTTLSTPVEALVTMAAVETDEVLRGGDVDLWGRSEIINTLINTLI